MKAIQIAEYGKPIEVAKCIELPDVGRPNADEVIIEVEVSARVWKRLISSKPARF